MGINLGKPAGAGVLDHLHMHVVPRWNGDTNFMTVVGQTRVLPEDLPVSAARLRPIFERLSQGMHGELITMSARDTVRDSGALMNLSLTNEQQAFQQRVAQFRDGPRRARGGGHRRAGHVSARPGPARRQRSA